MTDQLNTESPDLASYLSSMAAIDSSFSAWLLTKLNTMKIDENIFLNYILSIIEGDESQEEKLETLHSVLIETGSSEDEINQHCVEILSKYQSEMSKVKEADTTKNVENVDEKLARLLEANVQIEETAHTCKYSNDDLKIREAILYKYSNSDEPEDDDYKDDEEDTINDVEKNTNAHAIHQAEKEKREKAKLENQKKKERDKLEREKQKLTLQEKKDARRKRAQKVEHHRK